MSINALRAGFKAEITLKTSGTEVFGLGAGTRKNVGYTQKISEKIKKSKIIVLALDAKGSQEKTT
ncbi:hypothetical protein AwPolaro_04870 [Polaromonas sp.]|nr:hypothetical protein AwPolaro_04870 [Polaromonas sp.]